MSKLESVNKDIVVEIVNCAKEVFCDGIYVPCNIHPCGWDFISFECISRNKDSILGATIDRYDISNGVYEEHPFEDKTLLEILQETNGMYAFELGQIDW